MTTATSGAGTNDRRRGRRALLVSLAAVLLGAAGARTRAADRTYRLGILESVPAAQNAANLDALRDGLRRLGYVEGRNLVIDYRSADGHAERFPALAAELLRAKPDVIVTRGTPATQAALRANGALNGPCQIASTCTQIPVTKSVCEDNGGIWWGKGATDPATAGIPADGFTYCCDVNVWQTNRQLPTYTIQPLDSAAIRDAHYKLVSNYFQQWDQDTNTCAPQQTMELYAIDEAVPVPLLDTADADLLAHPLTPQQWQALIALAIQLDQMQNSQPPCPGDGNIDGAVNGRDFTDWLAFRDLAGGLSSWYDIDMNGLTDARDLALIRDKLGTLCPAPGLPRTTH